MPVDPPEVVALDSCNEARRAVRAAVAHYGRHHQIDPPYQVRFVFSHRQWISGAAPGQVIRLPQSALVVLDDDEAWAAVCPCDRRWWDIDLYPKLAADEGIVGFTASPERSDAPVTAPAGITVHYDDIRDLGRPRGLEPAPQETAGHESPGGRNDADCQPEGAELAGQGRRSGQSVRADVVAGNAVRRHGVDGHGIPVDRFGAGLHAELHRLAGPHQLSTFDLTGRVPS